MAKRKKNIYTVTIYPNFTIDGKEKVAVIDSRKDLEKFLDKNGYDPQDKEVVELIENGGEYKGINESEFKIEVEKPKEEIEKTPFNDAELFVKEFKDYLIGKKIDFSDNEGKAGGRTQIEFIEPVDENVKIDTNPIGTLTLIPLYFKSFIDGEEVGALNKDSFNLILQEEEKYNKPEFKYYIISESTDKILSGHEYKEDAENEKERLELYGEKTKIKTRKELGNIDLCNNELWSVNEHDWDIIKRALELGVEEKDFSPKESENYFNEFKSKGLYVGLIKARLLYLLAKLQKLTLQSFSNSNIERATERCDDSCRVQKELKRIIAMEK